MSHKIKDALIKLWGSNTTKVKEVKAILAKNDKTWEISSTFPYQIEVLPRLTIIYNSDSYKFAIGLEFLFWSIFIHIDQEAIRAANMKCKS